jgi:hypothetical protein
VPHEVVRLIVILGVLFPELIILFRFYRSSNFSIVSSRERASFFISSGSRMISVFIRYVSGGFTLRKRSFSLMNAYN